MKLSSINRLRQPIDLDALILADAPSRDIYDVLGLIKPTPADAAVVTAMAEYGKAPALDESTIGAKLNDIRLVNSSGHQADVRSNPDADKCASHQR